MSIVYAQGLKGILRSKLFVILPHLYTVDA